MMLRKTKIWLCLFVSLIFLSNNVYSACPDDINTPEAFKLRLKEILLEYLSSPFSGKYTFNEINDLINFYREHKSEPIIADCAAIGIKSDTTISTILERADTLCDPSAINSFGEWGSCSLSCGGGIRTRTNLNQCGVSVTETQSCNTQACCDLNVMASCSSYGPCSTNCGTGTQNRTCIDQCGNIVLQLQPCTDNSGLSVAASCGDYGLCSVTCGDGTQNRTCTNICGTAFIQTQECTGNGIFTRLFCDSWGSCSTACGTGTQARTCYSLCGTSTESQSCTDNSGYSTMSSCGSWSSCSKSCGGGTQTRTCTNRCGGTSIESQSCNTSPCPCNLPWGGSIAHGSSVTAYSSSSLSCGSSCSSQTRTCNDGTLSGSYQYQSCSVNPSPYSVCCSRVDSSCKNGLPAGTFRRGGAGGGCGRWPACYPDGTRNWNTDCNDCPCGSCCASC